ncbi:ATP-binding cassette domain-containing protein [Actinomadura sp. NPDC048955]|uniref:ABC-2 type transport system ATP-binding protein n=1 Tax=Actinomadura luteofluorescens TaxID=46163 RepID=A0A7Y9ER85_9ACTN|nr:MULTISPECIES: ATP-binding cassette domain-containing protein [Actinomadura]MCR3745672.1 ABC-2 type transport system ATP-binding protein [Actinomadura glauciflava]NYD52457.1 ABC-2 type transport system ATP-binding protein [Actinomadura luteofluorescens]
MPVPMIEAEDVVKTFTVRTRSGVLRRARRPVRAVDGVSFTVERGEFVGYLGPNGAGKSTTIKMLTGILTASSGTLRVCGLDPSRRRTTLARRIGVVFGQRTTLWWDLPLRASLALVRRLYRVEAAAHRARLAELTALLELEPFLDTPVRQLSLGQRMRGDLAAALLHDPELLVLDEPTIGLDVVSKATVRDFLERVNAERGTTILLTTHDLGDIERLCRRVMIVDHGRLAYDGGLEELRRTVDADRLLVVELARPAPPIMLDGIEAERVEGPRQWLRLPNAANAAAVVAALARDHDIRDISLREAGIEDVLAGLYRGDHAYWCSGRPVAP